MGKISRLAVASLAFGLISVSATLASAQLEVGDVAIVGFWADSAPSPKAFAFVALTTIPEGTVISFTDHGWYAAGGFRPTEGVVTYIALPGGLAAGSVVATAGDAGTFNLSASGDQIFAFEGTIDGSGNLTGTLFYGFQDNGTGWDADATSSNTSALPAILAGANVAMAQELDNYAYTGPTTGTRIELLASINNPANWTGDNAAQPAFPTLFQVTSVAEIIFQDGFESGDTNAWSAAIP
jgi:hypothetical protein